MSDREVRSRFNSHCAICLRSVSSESDVPADVWSKVVVQLSAAPFPIDHVVLCSADYASAVGKGRYSNEMLIAAAVAHRSEIRRQLERVTLDPNRPRIIVRMHPANLIPPTVPLYFIKVMNDTDEEVGIARIRLIGRSDESELTRDRPLPTILRAWGLWETYFPRRLVQNGVDPYTQVRVETDDGEVFASSKNLDVRPNGLVGGGGLSVGSIVEMRDSESGVAIIASSHQINERSALVREFSKLGIDSYVATVYSEEEILTAMRDSRAYAVTLLIISPQLLTLLRALRPVSILPSGMQSVLPIWSAKLSAAEIRRFAASSHIVGLSLGRYSARSVASDVFSALLDLESRRKPR